VLEHLDQYITSVCFHLPGLQAPKSCFQVARVPHPKLLVAISLVLQFIVVHPIRITAAQLRYIHTVNGTWFEH